jgi:eukaryotic-like serine/threonine-protein kinase
MMGLAFSPRVVGRYLLCDPIASGGMATVHLARLIGAEGFSRTVAIKQLHPQFAHDPQFVAMFLDEARLASRIRHPNVISPLDVVAIPPELFIVMDYVHGEPLSGLIKRSASVPVSPRIASALLSQVLLGLHAAHEALGESGEPLGMVHRDVSPHNILVAEDGVARVVDFGIAKAKIRTHRTEDGKVKGKLGYMSPEQVNLEAVDRRGDVFAAGVVLWELLTATRLFGGDTPAASVEKLLHSTVPAPSSLVSGLPSGLDDVVLCALNRSPDERFQTARAMAHALDQVVAPASALEVASWVEGLAKSDLAERARRVAHVESLRFDEFTQAVPRGALAPLPVERAGVPAAPTGVRQESPAVAGAPPEPSRGAHRRSALLGAALVPLAATATGLVFWALPPPSVASAPEPGAAAAALRPKPQIAAAAASPPKPTLVELGESPEPSAKRDEPAAPTTAAPPRPPARRSARSSNPAVPPPVPSVTSASPPAVESHKKILNCDVPYTVDKRGVKRFREECF